jgi:hypothetical protein
MFFNSPGKPTSLKKAVYLIAATVLGVLLSFILHAFIEIKYLQSAVSRGLVVTFYGSGVLPPVLNYGLLLLGAIGGFFLGMFWWRLVYVDRIWEKKYKK